ncbi:MAG: hypothetical protein HGA49_04115 [Eubacteriaceae bacterium]|nr:hypothetical protein [Eubacteriaceae bacterium]
MKNKNGGKTMRITLEQVEQLRKKIDCDYVTAEKALRKSKGNFNDAVLYLEKRENNKIKKLITEIEEVLNRIFSYNLIMIKKEANVINFPLILILLAIVIFKIPASLLLVVALAAVLADYSFEIASRNENVSSGIMTGNGQEEPEVSVEEINEDDDGFYEITVE